MYVLWKTEHTATKIFVFPSLLVYSQGLIHVFYYRQSRKLDQNGIKTRIYSKIPYFITDSGQKHEIFKYFWPNVCAPPPPNQDWPNFVRNQPGRGALCHYTPRLYLSSVIWPMPAGDPKKICQVMTIFSGSSTSLYQELRIQAYMINNTIIK